MPKLPSTIKTVKEACDWLLACSDYKDLVKVEKEIYQGTNPLLGETGQELTQALGGSFADVTEGVCHGMAVNWIRCSSQIGGVKAFHQMVDKNWGSFAVVQKQVEHGKAQIEAEMLSILRDRQKIKSQMQRTQEEDEYSRNPGLSGFFSTFGLAEKPLSQQEIRKKLLAENADLNKIDQRISNALTNATKMRAGWAFDDPSDLHKFSLVANKVAFKDMRQNLPQYVTGNPGFYLMEMNQAATGHAIAFHVAYRPRLMDANSCEFLCAGMNVFNAFTHDYLEIYARMKYSSATCELLRYQISLASKRDNTKILSLHQAVMSQLTAH
jgi:hypothetical protein